MAQVVEVQYEVIQEHSLLFYLESPFQNHFPKFFDCWESAIGN